MSRYDSCLLVHFFERNEREAQSSSTITVGWVLTHTHHDAGIFVGFFCRHVVDTSNLGWLVCSSRGVVEVTVAVVVAVVVA